jgi:hypothetical protein
MVRCHRTVLGMVRQALENIWVNYRQNVCIKTLCSPLFEKKEDLHNEQLVFIFHHSCAACWAVRDAFAASPLPFFLAMQAAQHAM